MRPSNTLLSCLGFALALSLGCGGGGGTGGQDTSYTTMSWSGPQVLEKTLTSNSYLPTVAMDGTGNVLAAWQRDNGTTYDLYGTPYLVGGGWQTEATLTSVTGSAENPRMAVSGNGVFMCTWNSVGSADSGIYATRYLPALGLETAKRLNAVDGAGYYPAVAMNATGDACVVWTEQGATTWTIMASRFSASSATWTAPATVSTTLTSEALWPSVGMDASGNAVAVWTQAVDPSTGPFSIWTSRFMPGLGWSTPSSPQVDVAHPVDTMYPITMTAAGAQVAWVESIDSGASFQLYTRRWTAANDKWSDATRVSSATADVYDPTLAMDYQGNVLLAWSENPNTATFPADLYLTAYHPSSGWQATPQAVALGTGGISVPKLSMNAAGSGALAWLQTDGTLWRTYGAVYFPATGLAKASVLQGETGGRSATPEVHVGANDQVVVVWSQHEASDSLGNPGLSHIYANRYR